MEVSQYLYRICKIYGNDIEFQDSTRNLVDDMFEKNKHIFSAQFFYFVVGYMLPLYLQMFILTEQYQIKGCQILCLFTICVFFIYSIIQFSVQQRDFFKKFFNINDLALYTVYGIYFGLKYYDNRNYMPEFITQDGRYEGHTPGHSRLLQDDEEGGDEFVGPTAMPPVPEPEWVNPMEAKRRIWKIAVIGVLQIFLMICTGAKFLQFLKVYESFYQMLSILQYCMQQVIPFGFLLYSWVIMMSFVYRILGVDNGEMGQSEYPLFGPFTEFAFTSYRTAIGDS